MAAKQKPLARLVRSMTTPLIGFKSGPLACRHFRNATPQIQDLRPGRPEERVVSDEVSGLVRPENVPKADRTICGVVVAKEARVIRRASSGAVELVKIRADRKQHPDAAVFRGHRKAVQGGGRKRRVGDQIVGVHKEESLKDVQRRWRRGGQ